MSDAAEPTCPQCGGPQAAGGLCPRCLLRAGLLALGGTAPAEEDAAPGYHLLEKIGEGGMGEVYLALQIVPVRREVAVKFLRAELDAADWTRRFAVEREALAQLDHPHIAMILDAGTGRDGRPFYVMELIDGLALTLFCQRKKTDVQTRLRLFTTVCGAVQHAHQKGVLHGDLKPSNILVEVDELGAAVPKLIDFGIARAARAQRGGGDAAALPFGTPGYASPEQRGGERPPDARSDVYSLGIVLRELLEEGGALHGESRWIVERATNPVPERRYESAAALAADVNALQQNRPLTAGPKTWRYRAAKFCRRHRVRIAVFLTAALVISGTAMVFGRQALHARRTAEEMAAARRRAEVEMQRSAQMDSLLHGLVQAMHEPDAQHRQHRAQKLIKRIGHEADDHARAGHIDSALSMHMALGAAARGLGAPEEAAEHFLAAHDLAARAGIPGDPRRRAAAGALARCYIAARNFAAAEEVLKSLTNEAPGSGPRGNDTWEPFMDLARVYLQTRRFDEAAAPALHAVEVTERTFDRLHPHFLDALHLLGKVRTEQRHYEEAHKILTETAAGMTQQLGADSPPARAAATDLSEVETVLQNMEKLPQK